MNWKSLCYVLLGCFLGGGWGHSAQPIPAQGGEAIVFRPESENRWQARTIYLPSSKIEGIPEFFRDEFGESLTFDKPWARDLFSSRNDWKISDGILHIKGDKKGFSFVIGADKKEWTKTPLNFGLKSGKCKNSAVMFDLELKQKQARSIWIQERISNTSPVRQRFAVEGTGWQVVSKRNSNGWNHFRNPGEGIRYTCLTPFAEAEIRSVKITSIVHRAYARKTFSLAQKPVFAHASFLMNSEMELYVNGKLVVSGNHSGAMSPCETKDLLPYLRQGKNVIALVLENSTYGDPNPPFYLEGIAFDAQGNLTRFMTDRSWKANPAYVKGWLKDDFDDSSWQTVKRMGTRPGLNPILRDRRKAFNGVNPTPMGLLQPQPMGMKHPLFDYDKPIRYQVLLPKAVALASKVEVSIAEFPSGKVKQTLIPSGKLEEKGWIRFIFTMPQMQTGAYKLHWSLKGKNQDALVTTMVVCGPISQPAYSYDEFEKKFEEQLVILDEIDCTKPAKNSRDFVDHSGNGSRPAKDLSRVVFKDGMRYRETGANCADHFGYRINYLKYHGQPLVVEVLVPDNDTRVVNSQIFEGYPSSFCNNGLSNRPGGFGVASGNMRTGLGLETTGTLRKLRYLYWPGSAYAMIHVGNWSAYGARAAAAKIRFYRLKSGVLPYVKGGMSRLIGPHCERVSNIAETLSRSFDVQIGAVGNYYYQHMDAYGILFQMYQEKIRFLRHLGWNFIVEGAYMYQHSHYPSDNRHSFTGGSSGAADPLLLALKLYKFNDIKADIGFEYLLSPQSGVKSTYYSDRDNKLGKGSPTHWVDKYGRQILMYGPNFLHREEADILLDLVKDIADRYKHEPAADRFMVISGSWWSPGFLIGNRKDIDVSDVGYGDVTVNLFEQETGIRLGLDDKDPQRFMKRWQKLMGTPLEERWLAWRAKKLKEAFARMQQLVAPMKLNVSANVLNNRVRNPFGELSSTFEEREEYPARRFELFGTPSQLYLNDPGLSLLIPLRFLRGTDRPANDKIWYGWNQSKSIRDMIGQFGEVFWNTTGLEEVGYSAPLNKEFIFGYENNGYALTHYPEEHAMKELSNLLNDCQPTKVVHGWSDCQMDGNIACGISRFALGYRAIPKLDMVPYDAILGGAPMLGKEGRNSVLRLINGTDYPAKLILQLQGEEIRELVRGRSYDSGTVEMILQPGEIAVFKITDMKRASGKVCHSPEMQEQTRKEVDFMLKDPFFPERYRQPLQEMLAKGDLFSAHVLAETYELYRIQVNARRDVKAANNQQRFLHELKEKGIVRVNCGYGKDYVAPNGELWLPDQQLISKAYYGGENTFFVDRGKDFRMEGKCQQRVYSTEAFGPVITYFFPVPAGDYQVHLHFGETFHENSAPGDRRFHVDVQRKRHPQVIDPIKLTGGFAKPYILTVPVTCEKEGIEIRLSGNTAILGIEIEEDGGFLNWLKRLF